MGRQRSPTTGPGPSPPAADLSEFRVALERREFLYYNWVLAFERPTLRFLLTTFVLFSLASLLGVWPAGRVFALAVLVPIAGYSFWLVTSSNALYRRHPAIGAERVYRFGEEGYAVTGDATDEVSWSEVARAIEARPAIYLVRRNGLADLVPKRALADPAAFVGFVRGRVGEFRRSAYL